MTMIIGIIAETGIVLAADTRCMIGDSGTFLAYHERARKIAVSSQTAPSQIACAIACSVSGLSIIEDAERSLSNHRYRRDTSLHLIHCEFEQKYRKIRKSDPSVRISSIATIFAKYEIDCPCLSYGTLSDNIEISAHSGVQSDPQISENPFKNNIPTKDQAIQFAEAKTIEKAKTDDRIGKTVDIVYLTPDKTEWVRGEDRVTLPLKTKDLYEEYKRNPSIITVLQEKDLLEKWFKDNLWWKT